MENLTEKQNQTAEAGKQKITFFSATDEKNQTLEEFMPDLVMSESTLEAVKRMKEVGFDTGNKTNVLINLPGFSLVYAWFKSGFQLPVHSHNADCLYYVVAGEAILGNRRVKAGDGFFVPKDVWYSYTAGPEGIEILEFRHANLIDMVWRDSKPEYWDNIVDNIDKSREKWKVETPPTRASTGLG